MHVSPSLELLCAADEPGDRSGVIGIDQDIVLDIQQRAALQLMARQRWRAILPLGAERLLRVPTAFVTRLAGNCRSAGRRRDRVGEALRHQRHCQAPDRAAAGLNCYSDQVNAVTNRGQADVLGRPTIETGLDCPARRSGCAILSAGPRR